MKNKLEPLLNMLIQRGWKPYGIEKEDIEVCEYDKKRKKISIGYMDWESPSKGDYDWLFMSLRELVGRESGLWQFVCENKLVPFYFYDKETYTNTTMSYEKTISVEDEDGIDIEHNMIYPIDYHYRLIESALKDESKLEDFLLSNIKVEGIS